MRNCARISEMTADWCAGSTEQYNRDFYDHCWRAASLVPMPGVAVPDGPRRLTVEVGCGLRPRVALADGVFVDVSPAACAKLRAAGARVTRASAQALPFASASIGCLLLFDVLEHVDDDHSVVAEAARVLMHGGVFVVSTPLHAHAWHDYDRVVGHARRYEPLALIDLFTGSGFELERFAPFGMRPRSVLLTRLAAYYLLHWPRMAFWFQELVLRRYARGAAPTALYGTGLAAFMTTAATSDGVVTAWRRVRASV